MGFGMSRRFAGDLPYLLRTNPVGLLKPTQKKQRVSTRANMVMDKKWISVRNHSRNMARFNSPFCSRRLFCCLSLAFLHIFPPSGLHFRAPLDRFFASRSERCTGINFQANICHVFTADFSSRPQVGPARAGDAFSVACCK